MHKEKSNRILWIVSVVFAGLFGLLFIFTGNLYADNDNLMIGVVTSGLYGDYYCQYLHPALCVFLHYISKIFPRADAFLLITELGAFLEISLLVYIVFLETTKSWREVFNVQESITCVTLLSGIVFLSTAINIWSINYTAQSASFVFAGLIGLFEYRKLKHGLDLIGDQQEETSIIHTTRKEQYGLLIICLVLFILGFMMRVEAALIFIPYILLNFISEAFAIRVAIEGEQQKKTQISYIKTHLKILLPCAAIIAILLISKEIFWSIEPYASSQQYNEARTVTGDFHMKDWEDVEDEIEDTDYTEYKSPIVWSLIDTDVLTTEKIEYIAKVGSDFRYSFTTRAGWHFALKEMRLRLFRSNLQLLLLFIASTLLLMRNIVLLKSLVLKAESILAFVGSFIILLY
ncbi:MAG: hypothetical protein IKF90_03595, partial [Parasporobacterium sp.]|nr:hypothetical protein [Parasporobacterium sp.]